MTQLPIFQVDAFAARPFTGNPAAVCPLEGDWLPVDLMQAIAMENQLSETAFFVPRGEDFELRWFTPVTEVDLCGHATLASAFVVMTELRPSADVVRFHTQSGLLTVRRSGARFVLDFPARPPKPAPRPEGLDAALGASPSAYRESVKGLAVFDDEKAVRRMQPDFRFIAKLRTDGLIVTAPGLECDFVSRFFAPGAGIDEDPVTGSAHCTLVPYWSKRLGKRELFARQVSARGGELWCVDRGDRVDIAGEAVLYLRGTIAI